MKVQSVNTKKDTHDTMYMGHESLLRRRSQEVRQRRGSNTWRQDSQGRNYYRHYDRSQSRRRFERSRSQNRRGFSRERSQSRSRYRSYSRGQSRNREYNGKSPVNNEQR